MDYCELAYKRVKGGCSVTYFSNQAFSWDLSIGKRVQQQWPDDVSFSMHPERRKDVALTDYISNAENALLASPRLQDFFRAQNVPDLEFLRVTIYDHKQRVAASDYAVVHCCRVVDCVDQGGSEFEWDGLDNPSMMVRKMVLDQGAIGPDDRVIRPRYVPGLTLYRKDVVDAINAQAFSGVGFLRMIFGDSKRY
jgi:hypothetical protein